MNSAQLKKYEIKIAPPAKVILAESFNHWEWIPHERQPMSLFSAVVKNRDLFQSINDDFWDNYVKPFFVKNGKKKLTVFGNSHHPRITDEPIKKYGLLKSDLWDISKGAEPSYNFQLMLSLKNLENEILEYQTEIHNRAALLVSKNSINGEFALDTIKNALLMFISSDVQNFSKYFKKVNLSNSIFLLPIRKLTKIDRATHIVSDEYGYHSIDADYNGIQDDKRMKDYSNFWDAYGISKFSSVHDSFHTLGMANGFFDFPEVFEDEVSRVSNELKIKDFFAVCVADGFMEYALLNKKLKLKIPSEIKNKMDFLIWKKIAGNTKITAKNLLALLVSFGNTTYMQSRHAYYLKGLNFLLNETENLHERKYFLKLFENTGGEVKSLAGGNDKIHPFWFEKSMRTVWLTDFEWRKNNGINISNSFLLSYRDAKWLHENLDFSISPELVDTFFKYDNFMLEFIEENQYIKDYLYSEGVA